MIPQSRDRWWTALRWVLGALMLWAAVSKLANPTEFLSSIFAYETPLPKPWLRAAAVVLPWLELLSGLLLIANVWTETALATMIALLVIFAVATGQAWARGLDISCGCFNLEVLGADPSSKLVKFIESASFAFLRNLVLVALATMLLRKRLAETEAGAQSFQPAR